jgi:hypothetical protein
MFLREHIHFTTDRQAIGQCSVLNHFHVKIGLQMALKTQKNLNKGKKPSNFISALLPFHISLSK